MNFRIRRRTHPNAAETAAMNDPAPAETPSADELQFDRAEYASPTAAAAETTCGACKRPILDTYYALNDILLCPECRDRVEQQWRGGSRIGRSAKATLLGSLAAVAGFAIYFGVLKIANKGLDMFLTYTAIVASYSGVFIPAMFAKFEADRAEKVLDDAKAQGEEKPAEAAKGVPAKEAPAKVGEAEATQPWPLALALFVGLLYALPIMVGFQQPIGLFIIAFALWEAWKMNRRAHLVINGPYAVGGGGAEPGPARA
jgi:hypothetical protein